MMPMGMKKTTRKITCIDSRCFTSEYDAGKYLLQLASEHRRVKISRFEVEE
jgi:hypothetical protein